MPRFSVELTAVILPSIPLLAVCCKLITEPLLTVTSPVIFPELVIYISEKAPPVTLPVTLPVLINRRLEFILPFILPVTLPPVSTVTVPLFMSLLGFVA